MHSKRDVIKLILLWLDVALIIATLAFIWGNSCQPKQVSSQTSQGVYEKIEPILDATFGKGVITHAIFRKMAHSIEFMLLGTEVIAFTYLATGKVYRYTHNILALGLVVAVMDESIQILSRRGPSLTDVLIDMGGFIIALSLIYLLILAIYLINKFIVRKKTSKRENR